MIAGIFAGGAGLHWNIPLAGLIGVLVTVAAVLLLGSLHIMRRSSAANFQMAVAITALLREGAGGDGTHSRRVDPQNFA